MILSSSLPTVKLGEYLGVEMAHDEKDDADDELEIDCCHDRHGIFGRERIAKDDHEPGETESGGMK